LAYMSNREGASWVWAEKARRGAAAAATTTTTEVTAIQSASLFSGVNGDRYKFL
jgi:hypothetical protein